MCVIDGRIGYIGGMNIATRYVRGRKVKQERPTPWRDTHLRLQGPAVYGLQRAFLVDWYFVDRTLITNRSYYPPVSHHSTTNDCLIQTVTSSPITSWPDIMQGYVRILLEAKNYVFIETPYFLPTETVLFAMQTAVLSGVDVRVMIPFRTDTQLAQWASRTYVRQAAEAGVKVYLYQAGFNHSKLLVSDDNLCTCGSTNVDFRSFENNFEGNAFIYDRDMALRMRDVFEQDMTRCLLYDDLQQKWRPAFVERLWESVVRLLSPLL
jgi:cardiolipin synthase